MVFFINLDSKSFIKNNRNNNTDIAWIIIDGKINSTNIILQLSLRIRLTSNFVLPSVLALQEPCSSFLTAFHPWQSQFILCVEHSQQYAHSITYKIANKLASGWCCSPLRERTRHMSSCPHLWSFRIRWECFFFVCSLYVSHVAALILRVRQ